jgi:ABC-type sugar transport system permease subunit
MLTRQGQLGWAILLAYLALAVLNALGVYWAVTLAGAGAWAPAASLVLALAIIDYILLSPRMMPWRYLLPTLLLMGITVVYPIGYTAYVATTNYSATFLLTKQQAIDQITNRYFRPAQPRTFESVAYRDPSGRWAFLLTDREGELYWATPEEGVDPLPEGDPRREAPAFHEEYRRLERAELTRLQLELSRIVITEEEFQLRLSTLTRFDRFEARYHYELESDTMIDIRDGKVYRNIDGAFRDDAGDRILPGFRASVGLDNFTRIFTNPQISRPFVRVLVWTFAFATLTVAFNFALGLAIAILVNDPTLRLRTFYRVVLIVPYAIPGFIAALLWVGFLNVEIGLINSWLGALFGIKVPWLTDPNWARASILLVNLWLGYPYMMVISLGALQSIPVEIYEAATIDGATRWQQFTNVTLPLIMLIIAPLLIGAFAFNFNNFTVVYLVTGGGPPVPGAQTPAGHTDILISYTYRLAFEGGQGTDYAFAAAISLVIFVIIATISAFNFRFTRSLEELSKNV